ncbi:MAG TPA: hypothetical protein VI434_12260 [Candidatus Dormibacteraeota bacterium]
MVRQSLKVSALLVVAAGVCVFPLQASANTKTVSVDTSGRLTTPTTSGKITFNKLAPNTTYSGVDALEALPVGTGFAHGRYTISWGACTQGSAVGGSFKVVSGGAYPHTLPKTNPSPTPIKIRTNDDGVFSCTYTLAYPAGNIPEKAVHVKNDFWVVNKDGTIATQVDSKSVLPGAGPPVPEVPLAILIPIGMVLVIAGYVLFLRRRQTLAAAPA